MKKSLLFLFVSLAFWATAQPPQNFSYQAAIRNSEGAALVDQSVTLRISLTNQSESQLFLVETHQTTSNAQGVVGIAIGSGTLVSGSFTAIPWGTNQIYIKTEVQTQQSGSFVDLGTTQLLSVPYALFAADGNQGAAGADGRTVLNGTSNPQSTLGTNGDFYINTTTNTLFGPKVGTNWGTGVLLVGPQGPQGTAGAMGATGTNGISVHWLGTFASHPGSPTLNQAYYNSTDKKSYVYNGTIWQIITQDGADAVSAVTGTGTAGKIAVWSAESVLTNIESFNIDPNVEVISDPAAGIDDPIFEVKNKDGKVVFGVYQSGVRIYVDDTETKAAKGGFAIGGLSNSTKVDEGIYFRVTPDSVRVLLRESTTKAAKGGFAIGGLSNSTKGVSQNLFFINSDSARIYINDATSKAAKGGFAIGGLSNSTKGDVEYMRISADSARIYINDDPAKAAKGGFAIGGLSNSTKAFGEEYLRITRDSARIN
ncbi:MAG: hypothetical protein RBR35_15195, partial [Salinivirgaceae bacterium]|nr:hypothetical protein [Salinivirgaceae bacterium]